MADATSPFSSIVPGFEFLQNLMKNAGQAMPSLGQWVAPTLDPEEINKRIDELKTVQFWLEQNARMLAATVQALEVQRMTLSTLKSMNVRVQDLHEALKVKTPAAGAAFATSGTASKSAAAESEAEDDAPTGVVDPMQWWGALTKQFTQLATEAIKDSSAHAAQVAENAAQVARMAKLKPVGEPPAAASSAEADEPAAAKKPARKAAARRKPGAAE